jgi:hypothetical protein
LGRGTGSLGGEPRIRLRWLQGGGWHAVFSYVAMVLILLVGMPAAPQTAPEDMRIRVAEMIEELDSDVHKVNAMDG